MVTWHVCDDGGQVSIGISVVFTILNNFVQFLPVSSFQSSPCTPSEALKIVWLLYFYGALGSFPFLTFFCLIRLHILCTQYCAGWNTKIPHPKAFPLHTPLQSAHATPERTFAHPPTRSGTRHPTRPRTCNGQRWGNEYFFEGHRDGRALWRFHEENGQREYLLRPRKCLAPKFGAWGGQANRRLKRCPTGYNCWLSWLYLAYLVITLTLNDSSDY